MTAKVLRLPTQSRQVVASEAEISSAMDNVLDLPGVTGAWITVTQNGKIVGDVLVGDISQDRSLAFAALSRFKQRTGI